MVDRIRLDGKVAVVTGAAGVIGTATIHLLAERGARVVAVDRREKDRQTAIKDLPASAQALAIAADVTREDEVAEYVRAALDKFGKPGSRETSRRSQNIRWRRFAGCWTSTWSGYSWD
jgi:NAD(P)-dependent dehydrogenase (short-subunit alcohol dehydrogenase family)